MTMRQKATWWACFVTAAAVGYFAAAGLEATYRKMSAAPPDKVKQVKVLSLEDWRGR